MFQFFDSLFGILGSIIDFFANVTHLVIDFFENTLDGLAFLAICVGYLPPFIVPIVTCLLGVAVVKFVLSMGGR